MLEALNSATIAELAAQAATAPQPKVSACKSKPA
jgi:hypothetical protein